MQLILSPPFNKNLPSQSTALIVNFPREPAQSREFSIAPVA